MKTFKGRDGFAFLDEREVFALFANREIDENVFRCGVVNQILEFFDIDFEILRLGFSTVNHSGHAACGAEFFDFTTTNLRPWKCIQCY